MAIRVKCQQISKSIIFFAIFLVYIVTNVEESLSKSCLRLRFLAVALLGVACSPDHSHSQVLNNGQLGLLQNYFFNYHLFIYLFISPKFNRHKTLTDDILHRISKRNTTTR